MDKRRIQAILNAVSLQELTVQGALEQLRNLPYEDLGFAKLDSHRSLRQGMAEVVFCPGKTAQQISEIAIRLRQYHRIVLASRANSELARAVLQLAPDAVYHELAQMLVFGQIPQPDESAPKVAVITAGTADLPAAEEAILVLQAEAIPVIRLSDVGVAGLHRLLNNLDILRQACSIIVLAGMDGALPSVVAGLFDVPVIAVPTSIGYGASFQGLAALLSMLNSCASGLTVANIDNGFGAATAAIRLVNVIRQRERAETRA